MMTAAQRKLVWILILVVFVCGAGLSESLKKGHDEYQRAALAIDPKDFRDDTGTRSVLRATPFQTLLPTLLGVREVLASLMWVQTDHYFHTGEYRPIIRMVRQITAIDPHQLDVYATGAWHMAYNFMDKRLIDDGVKFLEEGCKNNRTVYDLFFELGYMHYDKTKNFPEAVKHYTEAAEKGTTTGKKDPPAFVRHQLAHAMEKMGDIDAAVKQWDTNVTMAKELEKDGESIYGPASPNEAAAAHNLYITRRRMNERLAAAAERNKNAAEAIQFWQANIDLAGKRLLESPGRTDIIKDQTVAKGQVERLKSGKLRDLPPTNPNIHFTVTRLAPRKLLVEGTIDVLELSRVNVRLEDEGYEQRAEDFNNKMNDCTLEWENPSVRGGKFRHLFELDKDPADMDRASDTIYPLKAEKYTLTVTYDPRVMSAFIQDVYGWNGEGLTAKPDELVIDSSRSGVLAGKRIPLRYVRHSITLKREDLLASGKQELYKD